MCILVRQTEYSNFYIVQIVQQSKQILPGSYGIPSTMLPFAVLEDLDADELGGNATWVPANDSRFVEGYKACRAIAGTVTERGAPRVMFYLVPILATDPVVAGMHIARA